MDIPTIQAGLSALQSAIDITRMINSAGGALEKAELKLKLADIMSSLADAKINLAYAGDQILTLQNEVRKRDSRIQMRTWFSDGIYLTIDDTGKFIDGPFCARCLDIEHFLIRPAKDGTGGGMGYCPQCKNRYALWNAEAKIQNDTAKIE